mgnify:CR=1 FL=1
MAKTVSILGHDIRPGQTKTIAFNLAKLYTATKVEMPIIVSRAKKEGPTLLVSAGIHGDEINGVEIVRQFIANHYNKPLKGMVICVPILNIFGFLNAQRLFPDGRDLNRVFPGSKAGSLASRFAYHFSKKVLPLADYCIDFHTGGASRFNAPQIRVSDTNLLPLALQFNAPLTLITKPLKKSYRATCAKKHIPYLLFEGGKSLDNNPEIVTHGINGILRVMTHLDMLPEGIQVPETKTPSIIIEKTKWLRANKSGMAHPVVEVSQKVTKGDLLARITDPFGSQSYQVKAPNTGYIINVNQAPVVHQGDALFHISTEIKENEA